MLLYPDSAPVGDRAFIVIDLFGFLLLIAAFGISKYLDEHRKFTARGDRQQQVVLTQTSSKPEDPEEKNPIKRSDPTQSTVRM